MRQIEPEGVLQRRERLLGKLPLRQRSLAAHQQIVDALDPRDADSAVEWTARPMVDFRRGFAMAGLDMAAPIAMPTSSARLNQETTDECTNRNL